MRGQMFLIAAVFILVGMVMLIDLLGTHIITEESQFQESRALDKNLNNVVNEFAFTAGASALSGNAARSDYMDRFSSYIRDEFESNIMYVLIFVNGTDQRYYVRTGNYMNEPLNITINATGSVPSANVTFLPDKSSSLSQFAAQSNGTLTVNLTYSIGRKVVVESLRINVSGSNYIKAFYDVSLGSGDFIVRKKDIYERFW